MLVKGKHTGIYYDTDEVVRILNGGQSSFYDLCGVELVDVYGSRDYKTKKPIMVHVFRRADTKVAYDLWCKEETGEEHDVQKTV